MFGVNYTLRFAAVMDLGTGNQTLVLSRGWKVQARHGYVQKAYVKSDEEENL